MPKSRIKRTDAGKEEMGLMRLRNVAARQRINKFLGTPAVYMEPLENFRTELEKRTRKFKPKIMVGDLRKPNLEFQTDLR